MFICQVCVSIKTLNKSNLRNVEVSTKIESFKIDEFSLTTIMINEIVIMLNMTQFELTFIVKNLSQNLSSSCLYCSFELSSRSSLSNLNFERNVQIRYFRNRSQFDIQVCIFNIEISWFILLRERAFMTRIVEEVCTQTLFVMNYASLWKRLSLYWSFMFTFLKKLKACIHRWTSSEACKAMNLLLLDRWTQVSIFKYLVEQSLKSLARNVTLFANILINMTLNMTSNLTSNLSRETWLFWLKLI